jgi:hypothetical protein
MIRETVDGGVVSRTLDIPTRPDGAPLSREEFEAEFAARQGTTVEGQRQAVEAAPAGFTTAKGSTYVLHEDGTTTRNKAARPEHPGDSGLKERSVKTWFLTDENAANLAPPASARWRILDNGDGTISLITQREDGRWGVAPSQRNVPVESGPATGLIPFEVWGAEKMGRSQVYKVLHPGNPIIEMRSASNAPDARRAVDEAHEWYLAAHHAQRQIARLSEPARVDLEERIGIMEDGGATREAATLDAMRGSDDPEVQAIMAQIEALRAEGRLTDADMATLRAADEAAAEMEAVANGLEQAGACLLRNLA